MFKPIKIGQLQMDNNVFLAPMAGITDKSFRQICREQGIGNSYSEMVSAKSIIHGNVKHLLDASRGEHPWSVQIFGREPDIMAEAVRRLESANLVSVNLIDINMGCPAPKITKNGEGSALMREPALAGKIISAVVKAASVPVTVKIRKGFTAEEVNAAEIAKIAQESGAGAVTVHGRTRQQFYSGQADWDAIASVKASVNIPVIANGDVVSRESAIAILRHTGCDGLMVGRGAQGNPWLFAEILRDEKPPGWPDKIETALRHCRMVIDHKGEHIGVLEMRKHLSWYIKGLPSAGKLRIQINKALTYSDMEQILLGAICI